MATVSTSDNMSMPNSNSNAEGSGIHVKVEEDFLNSGRTGRRNAIPDIYSAQARVSTAELPANFARLSCEGIHIYLLFKHNSFQMYLSYDRSRWAAITQQQHSS